HKLRASVPWRQCQGGPPVASSAEPQYAWRCVMSTDSFILTASSAPSMVGPHFGPASCREDLLPLRDGCARVRGRARDACALDLPLIAAARLPPAYASPPDPTWIAGVYDAADYDVVVWLLTDTNVARDCARPADAMYRLPGHFLLDSPASIQLPLRPVTLHPRAPPIPAFPDVLGLSLRCDRRREVLRCASNYYCFFQEARRDDRALAET